MLSNNCSVTGARPAHRVATAATLIATLAVWLCLSVTAPAMAADAAFQKFLADLWPAAQAMGVSRQSFDAATRGLEADLTLPDLDIPGRPPTPQPEFVSTPPDYLAEGSFTRLAAQGQ